MDFGARRHRSGAKTKGKVERSISCVRKNFFYGREFVSEAGPHA